MVPTDGFHHAAHEDSLGNSLRATWAVLSCEGNEIPSSQSAARLARIVSQALICDAFQHLVVAGSGVLPFASRWGATKHPAFFNRCSQNLEPRRVEHESEMWGA